MKKAILFFAAVFFLNHAFSQSPMHVRRYNFFTFSQDKKMDVTLLDKVSSAEAKKHPEYGIRPYNAQCNDCVEMPDKRTATSRQYIDAHNTHHSYSQQSYFALHYKKSKGDIWRTIDYRLRPEANNNGVYTAVNQPVPTKCDLNRKLTSLNASGFEFEFNRDLSMYFYDENKAYTKAEKGDYKHYNIGEEGLEVKNIWKGIDLQEIFMTGKIKSNFVINSPLQVPIQNGWMVIEDHLSLPQGMTIEESPAGTHSEDGFYQGDYLIKSAAGTTLITYQKPVYTDAVAFAMQGKYKLLKNGNDYTLQIMVPLNWLENKNNTYPITIDPNVWGADTIGNFLASGLPGADLGFSTKPLTCDTSMIVTVPGMSQLTNVYADIEYTLTYSDHCGNPPELAPYCTFSQASMEIVSDACNQTTGKLSCNPALPPYTGSCTTDSNLAPNASTILVNAFIPGYVACIPPQCPDFQVPFTLKDQDSICGDVCGYLCAKGNIWRMTLEACQVQGDISPDSQTICAGQPDTIVAHANCGVPPYRYAWTTDGGNTYDTIYDNPDFIFSPQQNTLVGCVIYDSCWNYWQANTVTTVTVLPSPTASAGPDVSFCEGGDTLIGGNPTTSTPNTTIHWTAENINEELWLNNTASPNPVLTVPQGTVDSFYYIVTVSNPICFRTDTLWVYSLPDPQPIIDTGSSTSVCNGQSVTLTVDTTYASYAWNNGGTGQSIVVNQAGQYNVTVTDGNHCTGAGTGVAIRKINTPSIVVYPDTTIQFGDSVTLYTNVNLDSSSIDSFIWYPAVNISCLNCANPVVSPPNMQWYGIIAFTNGCTIGDSALIQVLLPNNFYIPNAFNPNNPNGYNTTFQVYTQSGVSVLLLQVFDRWGEKVFEGDNNAAAWNGTYKGKPAPPGVYVYFIQLELFGQENIISRKGSVTLIR